MTDRFGSRVRELRQRAKLSQDEFAARCDLDRTYISGIERGKRNVALGNIEAIAQAGWRNRTRAGLCVANC